MNTRDAWDAGSLVSRLDALAERGGDRATLVSRSQIDAARVLYDLLEMTMRDASLVLLVDKSVSTEAFCAGCMRRVANVVEEMFEMAWTPAAKVHTASLQWAFDGNQNERIRRGTPIFGPWTTDAPSFWSQSVSIATVVMVHEMRSTTRTCPPECVSRTAIRAGVTKHYKVLSTRRHDEESKAYLAADAAADVVESIHKKNDREHPKWRAPLLQAMSDIEYAKQTHGVYLSRGDVRKFVNSELSRLLRCAPRLSVGECLYASADAVMSHSVKKKRQRYDVLVAYFRDRIRWVVRSHASATTRHDLESDPEFVADVARAATTIRLDSEQAGQTARAVDSAVSQALYVAVNTRWRKQFSSMNGDSLKEVTPSQCPSPLRVYVPRDLPLFFGAQLATAPSYAFLYAIGRMLARNLSVDVLEQGDPSRAPTKSRQLIERDEKMNCDELRFTGYIRRQLSVMQARRAEGWHKEARDAFLASFPALVNTRDKGAVPLSGGDMAALASVAAQTFVEHRLSSRATTVFL